MKLSDFTVEIKEVNKNGTYSSFDIDEAESRIQVARIYGEIELQQTTKSNEIIYSLKVNDAKLGEIFTILTKDTSTAIEIFINKE